MRPKTVLVLMLVGIGVLGILVALKGILWNRQAQAGDERPGTGKTNPPGVIAAPARIEQAPLTSGVPGTTTAEPVATAAGNPAGRSRLTNIVATTLAEDREAAINEGLDQVRESLLTAESDPQALKTIRDRLLSPEAAVRQAAVVALMHLNDRASIPLLKQVLAKIDDPREKATIMDTIEYLQIPDTEALTNRAELGYDPPVGRPGATKQPPPVRRPDGAAKK